MSHHKDKKKKTKHRGFWLSLVLVLMGISSLLSVFLILNYVQVPGTQPNYPWLLAGLFVATVAKLVAVVGIWFWEKWALYIYAGSVVATIAIGLMLTGTWLFTFNEVLPLAILGWLLKDKYDNFD